MAIANKFPTIYLLFLIILAQKAKVHSKSKILNWKEKKSKSPSLLQYDWHSFAKGRLSQVITHFQVYPCRETYLTFTQSHHSRKTSARLPFPIVLPSNDTHWGRRQKHRQPPCVTNTYTYDYFPKTSHIVFIRPSWKFVVYHLQNRRTNCNEVKY